MACWEGEGEGVCGVEEYGLGARSLVRVRRLRARYGEMTD